MVHRSGDSTNWDDTEYRGQATPPARPPGYARPYVPEPRGAGDQSVWPEPDYGNPETSQAVTWGHPQGFPAQPQTGQQAAPPVSPTTETGRHRVSAHAPAQTATQTHTQTGGGDRSDRPVLTCQQCGASIVPELAAAAMALLNQVPWWRKAVVPVLIAVATALNVTWGALTPDTDQAPAPAVTPSVIERDRTSDSDSGDGGGGDPAVRSTSRPKHTPASGNDGTSDSTSGDTSTDGS